LIQKTAKQMEGIRGKEMGMIFQDPMTSLNPTMKIGRQITEGLIKHQGLSKTEAKKRGIDLLKLVGIPNHERRIDQYPHEFSGGMRQRAIIAIAISCIQGMLIADEHTKAIDFTIQAKLLQLLRHI